MQNNILFYGTKVTEFNKPEIIIEVPEEEAYKGDDYTLFVSVVRNSNCNLSGTYYEVYKMNDTKFKIYFREFGVEFNWMIIGRKKPYF